MAKGISAPKGQRRAWIFQIDYKGVDSPKARFLRNMVQASNAGAFCCLVSRRYCAGLGQKGREIGVDYVFAKNVVGALMYFDGKTMGIAQGKKDVDASTFFGELVFLF